MLSSVGIEHTKRLSCGLVDTTQSLLTRRNIMKIALYARVSSTQQAQTQTIEEQLYRLHTHCQNQHWSEHDLVTFLDNGYSGASLKRPGLDRLRDAAARAEIDQILLTEPSRLARNYVHQSLLLEELQGMGCQVVFLDRPMSQDPRDQLLLQIRGAVAEYERTLIAERMRRVANRSCALVPCPRVPIPLTAIAAIPTI